MGIEPGARSAQRTKVTKIGSESMSKEIQYSDIKDGMTLVTFGQTHAHSIAGCTVDKDCVAVVRGDRDRVFELFGPKFCFTYTKNDWNEKSVDYYPRGYLGVF